MSLIEDMRNVLIRRVQANQVTFQASDLLEPYQGTFAELLGVDHIIFSDPVITDIENNFFEIKGNGSLFGVDSLEIRLIITSILSKKEDQTTDEVLAFTILPNQEYLPSDWMFAKCFPSEETRLFDDLTYEKVILIATCYDHVFLNNKQEEKRLQAGINFYGMALVDEALESLSYLYKSTATISLEGLIRPYQKYKLFDIDLHAVVMEEPIILNAPYQVNFSYSPMKEMDYGLIQIENEIEQNNLIYPVNIRVPISDSLLNRLYLTLKHRYQDGIFTLYDSDFTNGTKELFYDYLKTKVITFTYAKIWRTDSQILIEGKAGIFQLAEDSDVNIQIFQVDEELHLLIYTSVIDNQWTLGTSFPELEKHYLNQCKFTDGIIGATTYNWTIEKNNNAWKQGIHVDVTTTLDGPLECLKEIEAIPGESIRLLGHLMPSYESYDISFVSNSLDTIDLPLLDMGHVVLKQSYLIITSIFEDKNNIYNEVAFEGHVLWQDTFQFEGKLVAPIEQKLMEWRILPVGMVTSPNLMSDIIKLTGIDNVETMFPLSFLSLTNLKLSNVTIQFLLNQQKKSSAYFEISLVEDDGDKRSWEILSNPLLAIEDVKVNFGVSHYYVTDEWNSMAMECGIAGTITIGETKQIKVNISVPFEGDWILTISPENIALPTLNDLATLIWPNGGGNGTSILEPLPEGLIQNDLEIILSKIEIAFHPIQLQLSYVQFRLEQRGEWSIIPNILSVDQWSIDMNINMLDQISITGLLHGFASIGSNEHAIANIEATLPIPATDVGWTLKLKEDTTIEVPSFGDLLVLAGAASDVNGLPENLQTIGGLTVDLLEINFNPWPAHINYFAFHMKSREDWIIIPDFLSLNNVSLGLDVKEVNDVSQQYQTTGGISAYVEVFNSLIWLIARRDTQNSPWMFELALQEPLHLPGIAELTEWMLPAEMLTYVPVEFMPFHKGFDITDLKLTFDITHMNLDMISFEIKNSERWEVIPGYETILVDDVKVRAKILNVLKEQQEYICCIEGVLGICGVALKLSAEKATPDALWVLEGELVSPVEIAFDILFEELLPSTLPMPYEYGLPKSMSITRMKMKLVPTNGEFELEMSSEFDWMIDVALIQLFINRIHLKLMLKDATKLDICTYSLFAGGQVSFCGLLVDLYFQTSNHSNGDTILAALITPDQLNNIALDVMSDTMTTTESSGDTWVSLIPSDWIDLSFLTGYIHLNLTKNQYFLYGDVDSFGSIVYMTKKISNTDPVVPPEENPKNEVDHGELIETFDGEEEENPEQKDIWGYQFALNLSGKFKFASLLPNLEFLDSVLTIKDTGLFLTSVEETTTTLMEDVKLVSEFGEKPKDFVIPLPIDQLPEKQLKKGLYFYTHLQFPELSLFGTLLQIGSSETGLSDVILSGFIPKDDTMDLVFEADVPDIKVFDLITITHVKEYPGIHMIYKVNKSKYDEFQLYARIALDLFDQHMLFDGYMVVTKEKLDARLNRSEDCEIIDIPLPFGMPGICIKNIILGVHYEFATETKPTVANYIVGGSVAFGLLEFSASIVLNKATAVLALIQLDKDLSINDVLMQCLGYSLPADYFDLIFLAGSNMYYYDEISDEGKAYQISKAGYQYQDGFHIASLVRFKILGVNIDIRFTADFVKNEKNEYAGMLIHTGLLDPIDLWFLQIASTERKENGEYIGGPTLELNTVDDPMSFGLAAGFNFFHEPFGMSQVRIRKRKNSEEMELLGHLESGKCFDFFGGKLSLDFTYSETDGFQIANWPSFSFVTKVIEILDTIEKLSSACAGGCGEISNLVSDYVFQTDFHVKPKFETENNQVYFVLTGSYDLSIVDENFVIAQVEFPPFRMALPKQVTMDELPEKIIKSIANGAEEFVKALLNNPEAIAEFLIIALGKQGFGVALDLLCRGLVDYAVPAAVEAAVVAAEPYIAAGAAIGVIGAAVIGAIVTFFDNGGGDEPEDPDDPDHPENPQDPTPYKPKIQSVRYENGIISIQWRAASYASNYQIQLLDPENHQVEYKEVNSHTLSYTMNISNLPKKVGYYKVCIRSRRNSKFSDWEEDYIESLGMVSIVSFECMQFECTGEWTAPQTLGEEIVRYEVSLLFNDSMLENCITEETKVHFATEIQVGTYSLKVRALADNCIPSDIVTAIKKTEQLPMPTNVSIRSDVIYSSATRMLSVTWNPVAGASDYQVQLIDSKDALISEMIVEKNQVFCMFDCASIPENISTIKGRVRAIGNESYMSSEFATSSNQCTRVDSPVSITLSNSFDGTYDLYIAPVQNAQDYLINIYAVYSEDNHFCMHLCYEDFTTTEITKINIDKFCKMTKCEYMVKVRAIGIGEYFESIAQTDSVEVSMLKGVTCKYELNEIYDKLHVTIENLKPSEFTYNLRLVFDDTCEITALNVVDYYEYSLPKGQGFSECRIYASAITDTKLYQESLIDRISIHELDSICPPDISNNSNLVTISWPYNNEGEKTRVQVIGTVTAASIKTRAQMLSKMSEPLQRIIGPEFTEAYFVNKYMQVQVENTMEWTQQFISNVDGVMTDITFEYGYSTESVSMQGSGQGTLTVVNITTGEEIQRSSFYDKNGVCYIEGYAPVVKNNSYLLHIEFGQPVNISYCDINGTRQGGSLLIHAIPYLDQKSYIAEIVTVKDSVIMNLAGISPMVEVYARVRRISSDVESAWSGTSKMLLNDSTSVLLANDARGVKDTNGDQKGDEVLESNTIAVAPGVVGITKYGPLIQRFVSKWDITSLFDQIISRAYIVMGIQYMSKESNAMENVKFEWFAESDTLTINPNSFETSASTIENVLLKQEGRPLYENQLYYFDVTEQLRQAIANRMSVFSVRALAQHELSEVSYGPYVYTNSSSNDPYYCPQLVIVGLL